MIDNFNLVGKESSRSLKVSALIRGRAFNPVSAQNIV
jgi:hypothetical protein